MKWLCTLSVVSAKNVFLVKVFFYLFRLNTHLPLKKPVKMEMKQLYFL